VAPEGKVLLDEPHTETTTLSRSKAVPAFGSVLVSMSV
jgi:hypothetical protein